MAKSANKPKEKEQSQDESSAQTSSVASISNRNSTATTDSNSNFFSSIFGKLPEGNAADSIFSDNNPFRRKPNDSSKTMPNGDALGLRVESPDEKIGAFQDSDGSGELKKRKRKKEKEGDYEGGEDVGQTEQLEEDEEEKRKKLKRAGFGDFESGKGKNTRNKRNLDLELQESGKEKVKKGNLGWNGKLNVGGEAVEFVEEGSGIDQAKKKAKKRKRDDVEAEYEARRYGPAGEEEIGDEVGVVGRKRKQLHSEEDTMVVKEGFDDESKLLRTVFVGNLPLKIKKKVLIKEFGKFGEIDSVRIRSVPLTDSKIPRKGAIIRKQINEAVDSVHAYVVFKTEESAQASLAHNMAVVGGNHIRVDRACPPRKKLKGGDAPLYDNKRTVFVGNLPFDVKDEELYQLFISIKDLASSIEAIRVVRDPGTSLGKGIAYVLFKTRDAANLVVRKHHLKLRDRELRLSHAKANSTQSKGDSVFPPDTSNKFAVNTTFPGQENRRKSKVAITYQGLRASKSGIQKKSHSKASRLVKSNFKSQKVPEPKERQQKRPAVAARKAKAFQAKQAGVKRKSENQTPGSNSQKKKARKFR